MSILNLTLLADILRDESDSSMYIPLLVLIATAIALQIAIGILSLMISNVSGYFYQFKRDRGNCCKYFICGKQDFSEATHQTANIEGSGKTLSTSVRMNHSEAPHSEATHDKSKIPEDIDGTDGTSSGTNILKVVRATGKPLKLDIGGQPAKPLPIYNKQKPRKPQLRGLRACKYQQLESEEKAVIAKNNIELLEEMISSTKAKLMPTAAQRNVLKETTDGEDVNKEAADAASPSLPREVVLELEQFVENLEHKKEQQINHVRDFEIHRERVRVYQRGYEAEQEEKFLERKLYWQNISNYIAYFVVVLNAFIAALKPLADSQYDDCSSQRGTIEL